MSTKVSFECVISYRNGSIFKFCQSDLSALYHTETVLFYKNVKRRKRSEPKMILVTDLFKKILYVVPVMPKVQS